MADGRRLRDRRRGADRAAAAQDDSEEGSGSEEEAAAQAQVCANGGNEQGHSHSPLLLGHAVSALPLSPARTTSRGNPTHTPITWGLLSVHFLHCKSTKHLRNTPCAETSPPPRAPKSWTLPVKMTVCPETETALLAWLRSQVLCIPYCLCICLGASLTV